MKKTNLHVVIVSPYVDDNGNRNADVWKRAVYEDESGEQFVRINGDWVALDSIEQDKRIATVYY